MSTLKSIIFETLPDPEVYWETAEALRDLDRQYQHFTRTVWKASKQLLKFDEINRLVAYEVEEKAPKTTTTRASSGRSSSSSKSTSAILSGSPIYWVEQLMGEAVSLPSPSHARAP